MARRKREPYSELTKAIYTAPSRQYVAASRAKDLLANPSKWQKAPSK